MADNKLRIEIGVTPEAVISPADIKNFQKTVAVALKDLRIPPSTIKQVTGLGDELVKQVLGDEGEFRRGIKAYSDALEKLSTLPFAGQRRQKEAIADFQARQKEAAKLRETEIKSINRLFATEAKVFGAGQKQLIDQASKETNAQLRKNLLALAESYKQGLGIVNRTIERGAEFGKGLDLIRQTGLDDTQLAALKKGELDAVRVVKEVSNRLAKEIRSTRDRIARASKTTGVDVPEQFLTSLGLSAQQLKEFESQATRALGARDRIAREIRTRRREVRETERFLQPEGAPPARVAAAPEPTLAKPVPVQVVAGPKGRIRRAEQFAGPELLEERLEDAFTRAGGRVGYQAVRAGAFREQFPEFSPEQFAAVVARESRLGRAEVFGPGKQRLVGDEILQAFREGSKDLRVALRAGVRGLAAQAAAERGIGREIPETERARRARFVGPDLDDILEGAFRRAGGVVGYRGVDIDQLRSQLTGMSRAQQDQLLLGAERRGRAYLSESDFPFGKLPPSTQAGALRTRGEDLTRVQLNAVQENFRDLFQQLRGTIPRTAAGAAAPPVPPRPPVAAAAAAPIPRRPEDEQAIQKRLAGLRERERTLEKILAIEKLAVEERTRYQRLLEQTVKTIDQLESQQQKLKKTAADERKAQEAAAKQAQRRLEVLKRVQEARKILSKPIELFTPQDQQRAIILRQELGETARALRRGQDQLGLTVKQSETLNKLWAALKVRQDEITAAQKRRAQAEREQAQNAQREQQRLIKQRELLENVRREAERFAQLQDIDIKLLDPAQLRLQKRELSGYAAALNKLEDELLRDVKAAQRLGVTLDEVRARQLQVARVTEDVNDRLRRFGNNIGQVSRTLQQFVRYAIGYGGLYQLIGIFNQLGRSVLDLQQDLKSIQAVTAATEQDMIGISRAITDVALSTRFSVREISQAAQLLGQAGVEASELQGVLQATANFASAVGANLETAADLVSTFRNVYSELSEEAISDQLTTAVNISKLAAEDLKTIFSLSAQTARAYNLTSEQYLSAVTTLRNAGIKASTVATGLRQGLIEIFSPDNRTLQILQARYAELGEVLSLEDIQARFFEIQQRENPLTAALRELERLGITGGAERQFGRVFDVRAMNVLRALIDEIDELEPSAARLTFGGSAAKAATTQMEALNAQLVNLGAAFTTFTFQLTEGPIAALTELTESTVDAIEGLSKLDLELKATGDEGLGSRIATGVLAGLGVGIFGKGSFAKRLGAGAVTGAGVAAAEISAAGENTGAFLASLATIFTGLALSSEKSTKEVETMDKLRQTNANKATVAVKGLGFALRRFFTGWIGWALLAWEAFDALSDYLDEGVTSFEKIEKAADSAAKANRQAVAEYEREFQDFENIRLTTAGEESAAGTAARAIEDLQTRLSAQSQNLTEFVQRLGGTTDEQTRQVQEILQEFSQRARAGEAGTRARAALQQQIADVLGARTELIEAVDFQLNALLAEEGDINGFMAQYVESFQEAINDARAAGTEASEVQKALLQSFEELEPEEIVEITSLASEAREGTIGIVEQVLRRANELIRGTMAGRREEALAPRFEQELDNTAELLAQLQQEGRITDFNRTLNAFVEANAGIFGTWQEIYDELIIRLNEASAEAVQKTEKGLFERGLEALAGITPFAFAQPAVSAGIERGRQQQFALGQRRQTGSEEAERLVRESQSAYARAIEQQNERRVDDLRNHYEDMGTLQAEEQKIYDNAVKLLPVQFRELFDRFQTEAEAGGFGSFLQTDEAGRQRINAELSAAFEAWKNSVVKAREQEEAAQKELRQKRLAAIDSQQFIIDQRIKEAKARGDEFGQIEALIKQRTALQVEENNLKVQELAGTKQFDERQRQLKAENTKLLQQQQIQLREEARTAALRVARLDEEEAEFSAAAREDDALAAAIRGDRKEALALSKEVLAGRQAALEAQRDAAEQIQDQREKELELAKIREQELGLAQEQLDLRREILDALNRDLAFQAETGQTREGFLERTRFEAAGGQLTREQRAEIVGGRLEALQQQDDLLAQAVADQQLLVQGQEDSEVAQQRLLELEEERFAIQTQMMQLQGEQQQLTEGIFGNLAQALDPEQLRSRLEEMNSGVKNVANTVQGQLVNGLDAVAGGIATVATEGGNLGDTLREAFRQTALSITQAILKAVVLKGILAGLGGGGGGGGFLSGLFGGGGGAATGATVSGGQLQPSPAGGGGVISGPGTGTSDSILGVIPKPGGRLGELIRVSNGESILNQKATNLLGEDFIHKINAGALRGFANGGVVNPREVVAPRSATNTNVTVEQEGPRIVNVMDPGIVGDFLDTPEGDKLIVNKIERNQDALQALS